MRRGSIVNGACRRQELGNMESRQKNETSQTQRVVGRSPEQPSPKCCSISRLRLRPKLGNSTDGLSQPARNHNAKLLLTTGGILAMELATLILFPFFGFGFVFYFLPSIVALVRGK